MTNISRNKIWLLIFLVFVSVPFVFSVDWGCCVDEVIGCRPVETAEEINSCIEADYYFEEGVACWEIPGVDVPVIDNSYCAQTGCCCLGDTFQENLGEEQCTSLGGEYSSNTDCYDACSIDYVDEDVTCDNLGGYWCAEDNRNEDAINLTGSVESELGRPSMDYFCYSLPCVEEEPEECVGTGISEVCSNGIDDDGDCFADTADSDCGFSIRGNIVDMYGTPISNVKLRFTNSDHKNSPDSFNGFIDRFTTYSVGASGEFFFTGFSLSNYEIEVIDSNYKLKDGSFSVKVEETTEDLGNLVVVPRNSFSIVGTVESNGIPQEGAIVSVEGTFLNTITDEEGNYEINNVLIENPNLYYEVTAFKEGFYPLSKSVKTGGVGVAQNLDFMLSSNLCSLSLQRPFIESYSNVKGKTSIKLNVNSGGCKPEKYSIYRCEGDCKDVNESFTLVDQISGAENFFIDESPNLLWNTVYTYYIKTQSDGIESMESKFVTVNTGDSLCKDKENVGVFCVYERANGLSAVSSSKGAYCDANNKVIVSEVCPSGSQCVEENPGKVDSITSCKVLEDCSGGQTNLFGLYSDKVSCEGEAGVNMCVYDYSETNVDSCFSCKEYSGCFDYRSEESCEKNICGVGDCEWSLTDENLNSGICFDRAKSTCSDCNTPFNRIFGVCNQDSCTKLGDCSFSAITGDCQDCEMTSCYDYSDEESCAGGEYNLRLDDKTNLLVLGSDDSCGIESCKWDHTQDLCYKDSDVNFEDDCSYLLNRYQMDESGRGLSTYTIDVCYHDYLAPVTSARFDIKRFNPFDPINGQIEITFESIDSSPSGEKYDVKEIYYCIEPEGTEYCKTKKSGDGFGNFEKLALAGPEGTKMLVLKDANSRMKIKPNGDHEYSLRVGKNYVKFFAVDYANNLEEIRSEEFYVDKEAPEIDVSLIRTANYEDKKTDLGVYVNSNEPVYCTLDLDDCKNLGNCDANSEGFNVRDIDANFINTNYDEFKPLFIRQFTDLNDGYNSLLINCVDMSGNYVEHVEEFLLDVDPRIQNPLPKGVTDKDSVTLSVGTISQVECRYTQDLNDDFSDISSFNSLSIERDGKLFKHTKEVNTRASGDYTFYVKCDYDPQAVEKINFRVDKIKPTVFATLPNGESIEEVGWLSYSDVLLNCEDNPEKGFGCNTTYFCKVPVPNIYDSKAKGSCTPSLVYKGDLNLSDPVTVCYNAVENVINNEGGLKSDTVCNNVFVDLDDPQLVLDFLPQSINTNELDLSGKVYDEFSFDTVNFDLNKDHDSFLTKTNYYTSFVEGVNAINSFDYVTTIDFTKLSQMVADDPGLKIRDGIIYVIFQYKSASTYGGLVFDVENNKVSIGLKNGLVGFKEVETVQVSPNYFTGTKEIRITKDSSGLRALVKDQFSINDIELVSEGSTFNKLYNGQFGIMVQDDSSGDLFFESLKSSIGELKLFFEGREPYKSLNKKVYFKINQNLKSVIDTESGFEVTTKLIEGVPRHGNSYTVSFLAKDLAGRESELVSKKVVYDLSGPVVKDITFASLFEQESYDYVEYAANSIVTVDVSDDYSGVSKVVVKVRGVEQELSYDSVSNSYTAMFNTSQLPAGRHDVEVTSYDGIGNRNIEFLENALLVEDRIDPIINLQLDSQFFNTPTPLISLTTDELAMCSANYVTQEGNEVNTRTSSTYSLDHEIQIESPLEHENNSEVATEIVLVCNDENQNKVSMLLDVIIDLRNPIYYITPNIEDLSVINKERHELDLLSVRAADKNFYSFADEPVKCRVSEGNLVSYENMQGFVASHKFTQQDRSRSFLIPNGMSRDFYFLCEDRAGNLGNLKEIKIRANSDALPQVLGLKEKVNVNLEDSPDSIRFKTIRKDIICEYDLGGESKRVMQTVGSSIFIENAIDISDLNSGSYDLEISCTSPNGVSKFDVEVNKDLVKPSLTSEKYDLYSLEEAIKINSSNFVLDLDSSELVDLEVLNNGVLIDKESGRTFDLELYLNYGYNDLLLRAIDVAGNVKEYSLPVLSLEEGPGVYFTNYLGGSVRKSYFGSVVVKEDINSPLTLEASYGDKSISLNLQGEFDSTTNELIFGVDLTTDMLFNLVSENVNSELDFEASNKLYQIDVVASIGQIKHKEVMYFNPYSEDLIFNVPEFNVISLSEVKNWNTLKLDGKFLQENYLVDNKYLFEIEEIGDSSVLGDLDVNRSSFNQQIPLASGIYSLVVDSTNDLGVKFGVNSQVLFDLDGPSPDISLYPNGEISYSSRPRFHVKFNDREPAKIISAVIYDDDMSNSYSVSGFDSSYSFFTVLNTGDPLPSEGNYELQILSVDENGNYNEEPFPFVYSEAPFNLTLISPSHGVSSSKDFALHLQSDRISSCYYSLESGSLDQKEQISEMNNDHKISFNLDENQYQDVFVQCEEYEGSISDEFVFRVGVDLTKPVIKKVDIVNAEMVSSMPYIVEYPLKAVLNISVNEDSYCKYDLIDRQESFNSSFDEMTGIGCRGRECYSNLINESINGLRNEASYNLMLRCKNKAGLLSDLEIVEFQVDLSKGDRIKIISPKDYVTGSSVDISVKTNWETTNCTYGFDSDPITNTFSKHRDNNLYHDAVISVRTLKEGFHNLKVSCEIDGGTYYKNESFVIDSTKPLRGSVIAADISNSFVRLSARANNFTDNESGIKLYEYSIGTAPYGKNGWNSLVNWTQTEYEAITAQNLNLTKGETYYWSVRALNRVNMYSDVASSLGTEADIERLFTNTSIDTCSDGIINAGEKAVDCGISCRTPCKEGDYCVTNDDCYSDELVCSNEYKCVAGQLDLGEDVEILYEEEVDVEIEQSETSIPVTKTSSAWLYWLLSIFLLIGLAGGGYYAYATVYRKDDDVVIPEDPMSIQTPEDKEAEEEQKKQEEEIAKKKEELKLALKKKLVDEEKKEKEEKRDSMFGEFEGKDGKTNDAPSESKSSKSEQLKEREQKAKEAADKLMRLKLSMRNNEAVKTTFDSHPSGISLSDEKIKELHAELLKNNLANKKSEDLKPNKYENRRISERSKRVKDSLKKFDSGSKSSKKKAPSKNVSKSKGKSKK